MNKRCSHRTESDVHGISEKYSSRITIPIFIDNQLAITLTHNPEFHVHTKHIEVCHHYICEKLEDKVIDLKYIPTDDQVVDIFTKPLQMVKYSRFVKGLSLS